MTLSDDCPCGRSQLFTFEFARFRWVDEFDEDVVDFGEVLGVRWLPECHSGFSANGWVYYIYWTHSSCGASSCYPCYDGEPTGADQLRLVSHD